MCKYGAITPALVVLLLLFMIKLENVRLPKWKESKTLMTKVSQFSDNITKKTTDLKLFNPQKKSFFKLALAKDLNGKIAEYIAMKPSDKDSIHHEVMEVKNSTVLIYNRINKSGSTLVSSETRKRYSKLIQGYFRQCPS